MRSSSAQTLPLRRREEAPPSSRHLRPVPDHAPAASPRRVADIVVDTLRELGVDLFLGVSGGAISPLFDALLDARGARVVHTRHETTALFMAGGYSLQGKLACALVTSGPGVTNALTGIASAHADGLPLVVIGGEVPRKNFGRGALQEGSAHGIDTIAMVRSITKYAATILDARTAGAVVRRAVQAARSGRPGPVFLSLPLDVASERVIPTVLTSPVATSTSIDPEGLDRAASALMAARRPLLLLGSGARHPLAVAAARALAEKLCIPVITSPKAKGLFPDEHPLALGIFGYGGHPSATRYLESRPDVILAVGSGLGETSTNAWSRLLEPTSSFVQIDVDGTQMGKNYHVDIGLVGPAHQILPELAARVNPRPAAVTTAGVERHPLPDVTTGHLHPARALAALQRALPRNAIFTSDIGQHLMFALHYLESTPPDGFIGHVGFGSMGSGIGAAIGAKLAHPDRAVVSICGDYGFQMFGMELATCVQYGIGVVFAIMNDARMGMVESGFERVYGRSLAASDSRVDFAAIARAHGARGITIRTLADLEALDLDCSDGPTVLDLQIDPDAMFAVSGRDQTIGTFAGKS